MSERPPSPDKNPTVSPRIVKLGKFGELSASWEQSISHDPIELVGNEMDIDLSKFPFEPNQNADIISHADGTLEITSLQDESTPGARTKIPISLPSGSYTFTVVGFSDAESTFFPWVMGKDGIRLTPTVHIPTDEEPISVQFKVANNEQVFLGVLCHRQQVGDKCYINSMHISKNSQIEGIPSKGSFHSINLSQLIPHQSTILSSAPDGIHVSSKPISTPGTYALIDVKPRSTISLFVRVSISFPSVAFLYVADSITGNELIKRNIIVESSEQPEEAPPSEFFSSVEIPSGVSQIRLGLLFSTVSQPDEHTMTIHTLEVVGHSKLGDIVDESYVINMPDEREKFALCESQASRFDFEISRWEAIDGYSEPHNSNWREYMEKPWNKIDESLGRKSIDRPGAWGYLLSMKGIFSNAIAKNHDSIAVFDDDFILSKSFDHRFSKFIELIGGSWDVAYLGASQWLWDNSEQPTGPHYPPDENTNGTFAVIYRKSVFETILKEIEKMDAPFDAGPLRNVVLGISRGKSFVSFPNIAIANLEKPGIRESRNQIEFSKRFGWDLEDYPPWFNSWSSSPVIIRDSGRIKEDCKKLFVTAVTTVNRKDYLQDFINDWAKTKSPHIDSVLIVADDGSTDGTIEWLSEQLDIGNSRLVIIRNNGLGIARQTNSIIDFISNIDNQIDAIFMCNDDIRFLRPGWDKAYHEAMRSSGYDHLVYFNPEWKPPSHEENSLRSDSITSYCTAREAMGCFYTLTPRLIDRLGFFDEEAFPVRGHSHVDYTLRACRLEANDSQFLFDLSNSNELIGMVMRDGYKRTFRTLSVKEMRLTTSDSELAKRESILLTEGRAFVPRGW